MVHNNYISVRRRWYIIIIFPCDASGIKVIIIFPCDASGIKVIIIFPCDAGGA